jgi:hypothetical protein
MDDQEKKRQEDVLKQIAEAFQDLPQEKTDTILNHPEDFTAAELDSLELQDFPNRRAREDLLKRLRSQKRRQIERAKAAGVSDKAEARDRMTDEIDLMLKIDSKIDRLQNPQTGITRITIENFKGISASVTIPLRPITLLFGANSAGKSTILQALHYTRELLERNNANADTTLLGGEAIELGGFRNIVHKHDFTRPIRIRLDITPTADGVPTIQDILGTEDQAEEVRMNADAIRSVLSVWSREQEAVVLDQEKVRHAFQKRLENFWNTALPEDTGGSQAMLRSGLEQVLHRLEQVQRAALLPTAPPESWQALTSYLLHSMETMGDEQTIKLDARVVRTHLETLSQDLKNGAGRVKRSEHFLNALRHQIADLFKAIPLGDSNRLKADYRNKVESEFNELMDQFINSSRSRYGTGSTHLKWLTDQLMRNTDSPRALNINSHVELVSIEMVSRWDPDRQLAWFAECNYWLNNKVIVSVRKAKPDSRPTIEFIDYFHPVMLEMDDGLNAAKGSYEQTIAEFVAELHGSLTTRLLRNSRLLKLGFDVVQPRTGEIVIGKDQPLTPDLLLRLVEALPDVVCQTNASELLPQARQEIEEAVKRFEERQVQLKKDFGFFPLIQLAGRDQVSPNPDKPLPLSPAALGEDREVYFDVINQIIVGITNIASQQLSNFRYIGPIREIPGRDHEAPQIPDPARWADGQGAWDLLLNHYVAGAGRGDDFVEQVSKWFENPERLDLHYRIEVVGTRRVDDDDPVMTQLRMLQNQYEERSAQDFRKNVLQPLKTATQKPRIRIVDMRTKAEVGPKDIGIGVAQSLPIVVGALDSESKILAIEQPELHLHPTAQARLGDLFISASKSGRLFLLETHSELFILRLLKRIRKTTGGEVEDKMFQLTPDKLGVLHVERTADQTIITELRVDGQGEFLRQWPGKDGFFEERARELFE